MAFRVSPGVSITEVDLTSVIPAVATTPAGFAGTFKSGPIDEAVTITSEDELKELFGRPDKDNATQNRAFHSAANFLGYGNNLRVVRVADTSVALNALAGYELGLTNSIGGLSGTTDTAGLKEHSVLIKNDEDYESKTAASLTGTITNDEDTVEQSCNAQFVSRYAGSIGNDIEVALLTEFNYATSSLSGQFVGAPAQSTAVANSSGGTGNDEIHILVKDKTGKLSGKAGTIALTKSLGKELAENNISVNCVTPAPAKTRIFDQITQEHIDYMLSKIPRNRFVLVEELASLVAWMSSEENSYTTGSTFDLSGGRATY